jgi:hypothetical protein
VLYGQASRDRFAADAAATLGGQELVADASMFNAWLQARASDNAQLQAAFVRRFTPEYRSAFEAWLKTDPFTNQDPRRTDRGDGGRGRVAGLRSLHRRHPATPVGRAGPAGHIE